METLDLTTGQDGTHTVLPSVILIATGLGLRGVQGEPALVPSHAGSRAGAAAYDLVAALAPKLPWPVTGQGSHPHLIPSLRYR